ncbi:MAG: hypothetical protein GX178_04595 [Acidobacteria bacterium]|jgi:hypothetical protein|nr:hypothetical protein [Thermoanaerobaculia bacterium]MDI9629937.1 hypothetical protein [Acidobacteriota bacterium]OQC42419.1 MAG: hypothetical protein BWX64_00214 [Acidobacteria bacterium ADurb.Bin051]MBP7812243.1 hypothetical protein [Thermoanaerobaculia bacterium]MBP8846194.1 hypothetical protein [Thermoanaerobaculia bacterium]
MITGYNTDVRHGDLVLHVQTEDKGMNNPFIESVIYIGGQVLAAKRSNYAALMAEGKGEQAVASLMEHQHRTIIAAIRAGRFDEKLTAQFGVRPTPRPTTEATVLRPEAAAGPTLDQVILDYLSSESETDQLVLTVEEGGEIEPGVRNQVVVRASTSRSGQPVGGAQVQIKILSTVAEPRIVNAGETDRNGRLEVAIDMPEFARGTAALIISAVSIVGRAEIKSLL